MYIKVSLLREGRIVGPFLDEQEREEVVEKIRKTASSVICSNNKTLIKNGLQIEDVSSFKKLDTVSLADLFYFLTHIPLDILNLAA